MSDAEKPQKSAADAALEREIREGRTFTMGEAIGRMAGPGAMKGESPVARMQQADMDIQWLLRSRLRDAGGVLAVVVQRFVKSSDLFLNDHDRPSDVLAACCRRILESETQLQELVRAADSEWGRMMGERPFFDRPASPSHPDDPYTVDSVRAALSDLLEHVSGSHADSSEKRSTKRP